MGLCSAAEPGNFLHVLAPIVVLLIQVVLLGSESLTNFVVSELQPYNILKEQIRQINIAQPRFLVAPKQIDAQCCIHTQLLCCDHAPVQITGVGYFDHIQQSEPFCSRHDGMKESRYLRCFMERIGCSKRSALGLADVHWVGKDQSNELPPNPTRSLPAARHRPWLQPGKA